MDALQSLNHTKWDCKYHVVFIPKCRRKTLYAELRQHLGTVFHELAKQKESKIEEGHLMVDHVHMMISIPPKYGTSQVINFMRGMTVGRDEAVIREYIRNPEQENSRLDQINLGADRPPSGDHQI